MDAREPVNRLIGGMPKIGIRPAIDGRRKGVREALEEPISAVLDALKSTLEETPPELSADIVERGIVMAGGGSLLKSFDKRVANETKVPVIVAEGPLTCVVMGTGKFLEQLRHLRKSLYS